MFRSRDRLNFLVAATVVASHISLWSHTYMNTVNYTTQLQTMGHIMLIMWNSLHPTTLSGFNAMPDNLANPTLKPPIYMYTY